MGFSPYLSFDGNCAVAMRFYADLFGCDDLQIMTYADAPPEVERGDIASDRVMHAQFTAAGRTLMGADAPMGMATKPEGFCVFHDAPTLAEARRVFDALAEAGRITMPFGPTFWSPGFGMLIDRWNIPWIVAVATAPA